MDNALLDQVILAALLSLPLPVWAVYEGLDRLSSVWLRRRR